MPFDNVGTCSLMAFLTQALKKEKKYYLYTVYSYIEIKCDT